MRVPIEDAIENVAIDGQAGNSMATNPSVIQATDHDFVGRG